MNEKYLESALKAVKDMTLEHAFAEAELNMKNRKERLKYIEALIDGNPQFCRHDRAKLVKVAGFKINKDKRK